MALDIKTIFPTYIEPALKTFKFLFWGLLIAALALWKGGCIEYNPFKAQEDMLRQLRGQLTEQEKQIQELNTTLGLTNSKLVDQKTLQTKYDKLQQDKDDADRAFLEFAKKSNLRIDSLTNAVFALEQEIKKGKGEASTDVQTGITSYKYEDDDKRVLLLDPNIKIPGDESLKLNQKFRAIGTVMVHENGSLKTERVELEEIVPGPLGTYKTVGKANLVDATFDYAPTAPVKDSIWDLSLFAEVGTAFTDNGLNFGLGLNVLKYGNWGLAADMTTDFRSWSGTGFGTQFIYRPKFGARKANIALGAGALFPFGGDSRVRFYPGLLFILY